MENMLLRRVDRGICRYFNILRMNHTQSEAQYRTSDGNIMDKEKAIHPYRKIHPWKTKTGFSESLADSVIYNKDGLVAINKPYGISAQTLTGDEGLVNKLPSGIPNEVDYTVKDALPIIARRLGYESLRIIKTPEKFTSGVTLLGASEKIETAVAKSLRIAEGARILSRTFWTVTRDVPRKLEGENRVAMTLERFKGRRPVPIIIDKWSKNARDRGDIKILNVQYKVLSHGTHNLASLVEIKSSTRQWHAVRLFAATVLLAPILGDRIYGSRVQHIMGKKILVNPGVDAAHMPPKLNPDLLTILKIGKGKDSMIPVHTHHREIYLPSFLQKTNTVVITAPLQPEFLWTCRQCEFNENVFENVKSDDVSERRALEIRTDGT
ncbi:mitochondrial mRNA pseudouridine synthase RPUSD3 [Diachasma alloeum]|uniref:mitochondrial mRNA pseudouridine synthase RPUSD3 n=1 Tax=Diachasma alloeum TaxID=454923 RepID=UPI0007384445|nr:mitochondrial mRNA pseudouridine synthase RPUSD3 [Diachasma alloeum]